jgi:Protein of unknown function (DUF3040)
MLSREDQRRFDEITRQLRTTDPDFVARVGDRASARRKRLVVLSILALWASVPAVAAVGGWIGAVASAAALCLAGVLLLMVRGYPIRRPRRR